MVPSPDWTYPQCPIGSCEQNQSPTVVSDWAMQQNLETNHIRKASVLSDQAESPAKRRHRGPHIHCQIEYLKLQLPPFASKRIPPPPRKPSSIAQVATLYPI